MKRPGILLALLLTATCEAGVPSIADPTSASTPDPTLAFRRQHSNPGGMWMPSQMTLPGHVEMLRKLGLKLDPKALADPLSAPLAAVVSLGGCTGSFVSPDGLIATNHHCVQGALQYNATPDHNVVENGFLAKTRADEKHAGPAARVFVARAFKDVTREMRDGLEKIQDPGARREEWEKRMKQLIAAAEKDRPGIRCQVSGYFGAGQYLLIENLEIRDVRLVYVPMRSVGNYGGEIDNWAWPRHTGDFAFYRAYVGKDGKPADYSPDNVPFKPTHWLQVSSAGLEPADFVMVTGYPGSTSRAVTALEAHHTVEWTYPYQTAYYKERYDVLASYVQPRDDTDAARQTAIKAGVQKQGVQNGLEKSEGVLKGLTSGDLLGQKDALDRKVKAWAAQPGRERHQAAIEKLEQIHTERIRTARQDFDRGAAFAGSRLLETAVSLTRWAEERAKSDADRKPGYQDRDMRRASAFQKQFLKSYDRTLDRASFRLALVRATRRPEAERPWLATLLDTRSGTPIDQAVIDRTLDAWYGAQQLEDVTLRLELLHKGTTAEIQASQDPFLRAAQRIWATVKAEERKTDARAGELVLVTPFYADAMREVLGGLLAPDANGTLRISYGTVRSFEPTSSAPADRPFTTASQIVAKDTGKEPFDAPKRLLDAIKAREYGPYADAGLGDELAVDFLSDADITGGNSGSPTLNARGEVVGLAFDGTLEGVASDWVFNSASTRTIHADVRYMLWNMDLLDGADHLIREMGLQPRLPAGPHQTPTP